MSAVQPASLSTPFLGARLSDTLGGDAHKTMSATQAWELLYLAQRAEQPDLYEDGLSASDADARIRKLRLQLDG